jgi:hypothetical protein
VRCQPRKVSGWMFTRTSRHQNMWLRITIISRVESWARLHLALLEQGELFAQEEVLGSQCAARPRSEHDQMDEIARDGGQRIEAVCQQLEDGARHERSASHVTRRYATAKWRLDEISADVGGSRILCSISKATGAQPRYGQAAARYNDRV